jgi:hypothetical protein
MRKAQGIRLVGSTEIARDEVLSSGEEQKCMSTIHVGNR